MTKNYLLLAISIFVLASCDTTVYPLAMQQAPYTGNELKTNGYYYSTNAADFNDGYCGIVVLNRNGVCIHTYLTIDSPDTLACMEEFLKNKSHIEYLLNKPTHVGVFDIDFDTITLATWHAAPLCYYGKIINDTTFVINGYKVDNTDETKSETSLYKFKEFSPKPDSISVFIDLNTDIKRKYNP